jgi:hypothetical protein
MRLLASKAGNKITETAIPRVAMVHGEIPEHQLTAVYEPMSNLILTGSKSMTVGDKTWQYNPATYFVMSVDLPAVGKVFADERTGAPYLAVSLTPKPEIIAELLDGMPGSGKTHLYNAGFSVAPVTSELLDAWLRMLRLFNKPEEIFALAPAYEREILFRVLQGPQGWMLRDIATPESHLARIYKVINWLKQHYMRTVRVEAGRHGGIKRFRISSPLSGDHRAQPCPVPKTSSPDAGKVEVSHNWRQHHGHSTCCRLPNHTQFSREYGRHFGLSPSSDQKNITLFRNI